MVSYSKQRAQIEGVFENRVLWRKYGLACSLVYNFYVSTTI